MKMTLRRAPRTAHVPALQVLLIVTIVPIMSSVSLGEAVN